LLRVGRLSPERRAALQAASVIGRRFDPQLLGAATESAGDIQVALADMEELDLAHAVASTGEYEFKHALVRDAVYQSLLTEARMKLNLRIAEEVERRSGNRLLRQPKRLRILSERPSRRSSIWRWRGRRAHLFLRALV
jgi:predicted ATPase